MTTLKSDVDRIPPSLKCASELEQMNREKVIAHFSHDLMKERVKNSQYSAQVNHKSFLLFS